MRTTQNAESIFTVAEINEFIKLTLESSPTLGNITVAGEISNFTSHRAGHLYFTLKDDTSVIKCVMFKYSVPKLNFKPEDGMKVKAHGRISVYPPSGQYQLYVTDMVPDGEGSLALAYEQLKKKLTDMGLCDESKKKPLPKIPSTIGIITSPTGAAIHDMINITGRRFPYARIILYPALVQGTAAPASLISGIKYFNEHPVDVIIIGRGGGSMEDLWAFNDEQLAYAVFASKIPTVSAVGHESDFTICDFVADKRAPTPSGAAELVTPEINELKQKYANVVKYLSVKLKSRIESERSNIERIEESRHLTDPLAVINDKRIAVDRFEEAVAMKMLLTVKNKKNDFSFFASKLSALNPLDVISRGYGAVYNGDGVIADSVNKLSVGDEIGIVLADGEINATVKQIKVKRV